VDDGLFNACDEFYQMFISGHPAPATSGRKDTVILMTAIVAYFIHLSVIL
jgi:hypothetical protein